MSVPANIRTKNPGAMWGGKRAQKWGATDDLVLHDGQSNHIAVFPTTVQGAAAQFDLWRGVYAGLSLGAAVAKWSGGNSSAKYIEFLRTKTGITQYDTITLALLAGPKGLALMKAQAQWEAGRPYPMTDAEWAQAQRMVFGGARPVAPPPPDVPAPVPAPRPTQPDAPNPEPRDPPERPSFGRRVMNWIGSAGGMLSGFAFDWRLGALMVFVLFCAVAFLLWLFGKEPIKAWISRHFGGAQ